MLYVLLLYRDGDEDGLGTQFRISGARWENDEGRWGRVIGKGCQEDGKEKGRWRMTLNSGQDVYSPILIREKRG